MSPGFLIASGVCQSCVIAPDSFATGMDWLLERSVGRGMNGITFKQCTFTDLGFADDISLLAELLELLVPALATFQEEAALLGLEVNWQKQWFKHWAVSRTSLQVFASVGMMSNVCSHLSS